MAQGFVGALPTTIVPSELGVNGILVNGWSFGAPDSTLPTASDGFMWQWPGNNLTEKDSWATPGQGFSAKQSPDVCFVLHKLVLIDGEIYDPSYGARFSSLGAWEAASVVGVYDGSANAFNAKQRNAGDSLTRFGLFGTTGR